MDERVTVPQGAAPPEIIAPTENILPAEIVEPDIFLTGEVNLLTKERTDERAKSDVARKYFIGSYSRAADFSHYRGAKSFFRHAPNRRRTWTSRGRQMTPASAARRFLRRRAPLRAANHRPQQ